MIEDLTEEILTVALRENELEYQDESDQYLISGWFFPSSFPRKDIHALFESQVRFDEWNFVDFYPDERNAASSFGEHRVCFSRKIENFCNLLHFWPQTFPL